MSVSTGMLPQRAESFLLSSAGLALGLSVLFHTQILSGLKLLQVNLRDARHFHFVLEWGYACLTGSAQCSGLWNQPIYYPLEGVARFNDTFLGLELVYAPLRLFGLRPPDAFQASVILIIVLDYIAFWLLVRRGLGLSHIAATCGACLFAAAAPRAASLNHAHLSAQFAGVLALVCLLLAARSSKDRIRGSLWIVGGFSLFALQIWCSVYPAWLGLFVLGCCLAIAVTFQRERAQLRQMVTRYWMGWAAGIGLLSVAVAPLAVAYLSAEGEIGKREFRGISEALPRPLSWFAPGRNPWLGWGLEGIELQISLERSEAHRLGWGLVAPLVTAAGAWWSRKLPWWRIAALGACAAAAAVTVWPGGMTLWTWVFQLIPGAGAIRAPGRIVLSLLVPGAALFSFAVERVRQRVPQLVTALILTLALVEQGRSMPAFPKERHSSIATRIATALPSDCKAFFVSFGSVKFSTIGHLEAMWAALVTGVPTVNGYSSYMPPSWVALQEVRVRDDTDRARLSRALGEWVAARGLDTSAVCWLEEASGRAPLETFSVVSPRFWPQE